MANNEITITVRGVVGNDPTPRVTDNGVNVTSFRLVSAERRYDRNLNTYVDGPPSWFTVTCWRGLGVHVAASLRKGQRVVVHGRMRTSTWQGDTGPRFDLEVDAETVGHDLVFGTAAFARAAAFVPGARDGAHEASAEASVSVGGPQDENEDADESDELEEELEEITQGLRQEVTL